MSPTKRPLTGSFSLLLGVRPSEARTETLRGSLPRPRRVLSSVLCPGVSVGVVGERVRVGSSEDQTTVSRGRGVHLVDPPLVKRCRRRFSEEVAVKGHPVQPFPLPRPNRGRRVREGRVLRKISVSVSGGSKRDYP